LADLEAGLGPATVKNDLSFDAEQINTTHIRAQWDIGPTRVDLYCLIFDFPSAGPSTGAVMLHAWHVTTGDKDKPPTWIRCSRKMVVTRGPEIIASKELPDLVLMIDDVEKGVYGRDRKTLGVPSFSDGRIAVKRGADNTPEHDEFRIDRVTGEYREIRVRPRGVTGNVDGSCAPFDPSKPKF